MQELLWYALSHGRTRPVSGQDVPLWFAALLVLGLLCAGALIGSGMIQWVRSVHEKRARVLRLRGRQTAGVLLVLAWVFWFHRWVPALLVVTFAVWVILHNRLEAGLGEVLHRRWRRAWPPGPVILSALLLASTLAFVLHDAPGTVKILPVGLNVLALSVILVGTWGTRVALPRWLGGAGPSPFLVRAFEAIGMDTLTVKGERT